jgi:hypothetical protein
MTPIVENVKVVESAIITTAKLPAPSPPKELNGEKQTSNLEKEEKSWNDETAAVEILDNLYESLTIEEQRAGMFQLRV